MNRYGDDRRTQIMYGYNGDMSMEDLIPEEEVVVTITRGGYIKRTRSDQYRSQHRGGKGIKGASLRGDDVGGALLCDHYAQLDSVLHEPGPRVPCEGLRAAGSRS